MGRSSLICMGRMEVWRIQIKSGKRRSRSPTQVRLGVEFKDRLGQLILKESRLCCYFQIHLLVLSRDDPLFAEQRKQKLCFQLITLAVISDH